MKLSDVMRDAIVSAKWVEGRLTWRVAGRKATVTALHRRGLTDAAGYLTDDGKAVRVEIGSEDDMTVTVVEPEATVSWSYRNGENVWGPYLSRSDFDAENYARGMVATLANQGTHTELIRNTRTAGETVVRTATVVESHNAPQTETEPRPVPGRRIPVHYHTDREEMNAAVADADARFYGAEDPAAAHVTAEREHLARREDSWERSGMDGALTQYAYGLHAERERLAASIARNGGRHPFKALFDLKGRMLRALPFEGAYGPSWRILDPNGRTAGYFNESQARTPERRRTNDARKGYYVGVVSAPATAEIDGGGIGCLMAVARRTDGGWDPDVTVIDNGWDIQGPTIEDAIRAVRSGNPAAAVGRQETGMDVLRGLLRL